MTKNLKYGFKFVFPAFCLKFLVAAVLIMMILGCTEEERKDLKAPLRHVRTMVLDSGTHMTETSFSGRLHAGKEASLSFKVAGSIQNIAVKVGDSVEKGAVIATLDPSSYALEAQKSKASLAEAQSQLWNARSEYERIKKLYIGGNESKSALDNARAASDSAQAAVQANRKAFEIARLNLSYTRLVAEGNCAIASVDAEAGENVTSGAQIFYTTCGRELEVKLDIPEKVISSIKKGMVVSVAFPAFENRSYEGMVNEVGVSPVGEGTTFPVTVMIIDKNIRDLKPGLSADVRFAIAKAREGLIVPSFAVGEDQDGRFVFVLNLTGEGRALVKRQPVGVGHVRQDGIEVTEGLNPGMHIVTGGVSVLREGMEVLYNDN